MNNNIRLHHLRAMTSGPALHTNHAYPIAEKQAYKFLRLSQCEEPDDIVEAIADLPRIRINLRNGLPVSGAADWTGRYWQILINGDDAPVRQRFSLAHEFKHIIDHPFVKADHYNTAPDGERQDHIESVCDYFAGCLLMPRPWLKRAWAGGTQDIGELARTFSVSRQAMKVRLDQTGLRPPTRRHTFGPGVSKGSRSPSRRFPYMRALPLTRPPMLQSLTIAGTTETWPNYRHGG